MAIIVFDDFNRADDPTGLGTATTGQTWSLVFGNAPAFTIVSNQARWFWNMTSARGAVIVVESGFSDGLTKVTLTNPASGPSLYGAGEGLVCRYVDISNYYRLVYYRFFDNRLRFERKVAGSTTTILDLVVTLTAGDTISLGYCGDDFEVFINDVSQGTFSETAPVTYGTRSGLIGSTGTYSNTISKTFDDFYVTTFGTCTPTYNCTEVGCVDPGDGTGTYATLAACLVGCSLEPSYNCVDGICTDPGDGSGDFATLLECQNSGCSIPPIPGIGSERFDSGNGTSYYVCPQIDDSNDELRSKTIKAAYVVGKKTNASVQVFGWDVKQEIDMADLEDGVRINGSTAPQALPDSTDVTQSKRQPVNVKNAVMHTVRVAGDCTGEEVMDRIDQITYEVAEEGVRR